MKTDAYFKEIFGWAIVFAMIFIAMPVTVMAAGANDPPAGISFGEWQKMQAQIRKSHYHFTADNADNYSVVNRNHGFEAKFSRDAADFKPKTADTSPAWNFRLSVSGYGYGRDLKPVQPAEIVANENRLEYRRGDLTEWYVNDASGMEQGFTIAKPPMLKNGGQLRIEMKAETGLCPELSQDKQSVEFKDNAGQPVLNYDKLSVSDADGKQIPAYFETSGNVLSISIDDRDAKYPLTVDPVITLVPIETKISLYYTTAYDLFGYSVSVSGDIIVVGANADDEHSGSAYVFSKNQGGINNWGLVKKITASDTAYFGRSVSVNGDIIVVGADGSAYVFYKDQGGINNWGQVRKITASNTTALFGRSVSVSGDIIVVGDYWTGSAYVFSKNQDGTDNWGLIRKVRASDATAYDYFGCSVSVNGDTIVVGSYGNGSGGYRSGAAYVFYRNQGGADNWGQVKKITASDVESGNEFGYSVSVSGDIIVVGAPFGNNDEGSAYVFYRNQGGTDNWGLVTKIIGYDAIDGDEFGCSVSVSGEIIVIGSRYSWDIDRDYGGSAYVFFKNEEGADSWGWVTKIIASDAGDKDDFGTSVSVSGNIIVVGSPYNDYGGSAYVFSKNQGGTDNWGTFKKIIASDAAKWDEFGSSVSVGGDIIVVGADWDGSSGSAYVFYRNQSGNWRQVKKITASDAAANDYFGYSVSVSGDIIVVGAYWSNHNSGAAYIFYRNEGGADNWGQVKKITASDPAAYDYFGYSVSVSGDVIVVGTRRDSAYVFSKDQGGTDNWGQVKKITASDAAANDYFGYSVSVSGDIIVVGSPKDDDRSADSGSVYLFSRNEGGTDNWGQVKKITASDPAVYDYFGNSVSVSGDFIVVGSPGNNNNSGSAYVFYRNQGVTDNWGQIKKIRASDVVAKDYFGISVSVSGDIIVVGTPGNSDSSYCSGSAYIFYRNQGWQDSWGLMKKIKASDAATDDQFGSSVSVSGNTLVVGAYLKDSGGMEDSGAAYIYDLNAAPYIVSITPKTSTNTSSSADFTVMFSENVTGVDVKDFVLSTTGTAVGTVSSVSGSGNVYTVTVSGISGTGSLGLNLQDDDSIKDDKGVSLRDIGVGNGDFTGETAFIVPTADLEAVKHKKAIIVAGGGTGYPGDYLWTSTKSCTDQADTALVFQGYDPSNIRYLAAGSSDDTTSDNLQNAITQWAAQSSGGYAVTELLIYMTGHGSAGSFTLKGNPNTTLTAAVLKGWLDTLQNANPTIRVILIYDACYSGSFIGGIGKDTEKTYERILIASAAEDQIAVFGDNGKLSFSMPFWNAVMTKGTVYSSFSTASGKIRDSLKLIQIPQIKIPSAYYTPSADLKIGLGLKKASSPINIGLISDDVSLKCGETAAEVSVSSIVPADKIQSVQADIQYYSDPNAVTEAPETGLLLSSDAAPGTADPVFRCSFDSFTKAGTYHVCIYAKDMNDKESEHICTTITTQSCGGVKGDLNNDKSVDLADAILALRVLSGIIPSDLRTDYGSAVDASGDNRIGLEDVVYILQVVAGLR